MLKRIQSLKAIVSQYGSYLITQVNVPQCQVLCQRCMVVCTLFVYQAKKKLSNKLIAQQKIDKPIDFDYLINVK